MRLSELLGSSVIDTRGRRSDRIVDVASTGRPDDGNASKATVQAFLCRPRGLRNLFSTLRPLPWHVVDPSSLGDSKARKS